MLFWICVAAAAALLLAAGYRYDRKHRNHLQSRSVQGYGGPTDAATAATQHDRFEAPPGGGSFG